MTLQSSQPRGVVAWMEVLERIQTSVGRSLQLADDTPSTPPLADSTTQQLLEVLTNRLAQLQGCLDRSERNAGEVERLLSAEAEAMRQWLEGVRASRQKLADWATRTV
jgi:hypothetical protein